MFEHPILDDSVPVGGVPRRQCAVLTPDRAELVSAYLLEQTPRLQRLLDAWPDGIPQPLVVSEELGPVSPYLFQLTGPLTASAETAEAATADLTASRQQAHDAMQAAFEQALFNFDSLSKRIEAAMLGDDDLPPKETRRSTRAFAFGAPMRLARSLQEFLDGRTNRIVSLLQIDRSDEGWTSLTEEREWTEADGQFRRLLAEEDPAFAVSTVRGVQLIGFDPAYESIQLILSASGLRTDGRDEVAQLEKLHREVDTLIPKAYRPPDPPEPKMPGRGGRWITRRVLDPGLVRAADVVALESESNRQIVGRAKAALVATASGDPRLNSMVSDTDRGIAYRLYTRERTEYIPGREPTAEEMAEYRAAMRRWEAEVERIRKQWEADQADVERLWPERKVAAEELIDDYERRRQEMRRSYGLLEHNLDRHIARGRLAESFDPNEIGQPVQTTDRHEVFPNELLEGVPDYTFR